MELKVKNLINRHKQDKDLTKEIIEPGWDWSKAPLDGFTMENLVFSTIEKGANFQKAKLRKANLKNSTLDNADFKEANLSSADLTNARLNEAKLEKAILDGAHMEGAQLFKSNLKSAKMLTSHLEGANLIGANLKNAFLGQTNFERARLDGANMEEAILVSANLNDAELEGAKLVRAILIDAHLENATLDKVNFIGADLSKANLRGASLERADLRGANICDVNLRNTELDDTNFNFADIHKTRFAGSNIQYATFSPKDIHEIDHEYLKKIINILERDEKFTKKTIQHIKKYIETIISDNNRYKKTSDIYRELKNTHHQVGDYESESTYHLRERRNYSKHLRSRLGYKSKFRGYLHICFDLLCGYGEKWLRPIFWFFFVIFSFGFLYLGLGGPSGRTVNPYLDSFYFSGVTFTTLGFGDLYPCPSDLIMRIFAMTEAIIGAFLMALFVVVLSKRIFR